MWGNMTVAYDLCVVSSGTEKETLDKLSQYDGVTDSFIVYGEYDVVLKIEVDSTDELRKFMTEVVRNIPAIERTTTLITI